MTQSLSPQLRGILWMVVTGLQFVAVSAIVKHLGGRVPAAEAAWVRYVLGLVFLIPLIGAIRAEGIKPEVAKLALWRGGVHSLAVITWFFAMGILPVAEVAALNYVTPIYVTLGAALFLNERIAFRRIAAILVAFTGVLIILRPGFREVGLAHLAMVATSIGFGASYLLAKRLSGLASPMMVVALLSMTVAVGLTPFALAVWVWPSWIDVLWLFLVACFATGGHFTMTLAFRAAPVSVTQPVTFLQLVWAVLVGIVIFGDPVDGFVISGGILIFAAAAFIALREAQLARR